MYFHPHVVSSCGGARHVRHRITPPPVRFFSFPRSFHQDMANNRAVLPLGNQESATVFYVIAHASCSQEDLRQASDLHLFSIEPTL